MRRILLLVFLLLPGLGHAETVKLSDSGICHDANSPWYGRTTHFTAEPDMATCLKRGHAYKGYDPSPAKPATGGDGYNRALYGSWEDTDHDCKNTRQEVLAKLSTVPVSWNKSGCTVKRGRWLDPYTGIVFLDASRLDIDHIVPLAYAHAHGADKWSEKKRHEFANDPRNLVAVQASANRSKGALGPVDWLPPKAAYQCEYLLRFTRIMKLYGLSYDRSEASSIARLRKSHCTKGTG